MADDLKVAGTRLIEQREGRVNLVGHDNRKSSEALPGTDTDIAGLRENLIVVTADEGAEGVKEFAAGLLSTQGRLGVHASLLRDYTARLATELRSVLMTSEVFQAVPLLPWGQDLITQNAIRMCEQILVEQWKQGDGRPYGDGKGADNSDFTWPAIVQAWEAHKATEGIDTGNQERIPESILRALVASPLEVRPDALTNDQIDEAGKDLARHYGSALIVPLELENLPVETWMVVERAQFWKEREDEFRKHDTAENSSLCVSWLLPSEQWVFRDGRTGAHDTRSSERIFRALAREAAKGLDGPHYADAWMDWLHALRLASDKSTGSSPYSTVARTGRHVVGLRHVDFMNKWKEPIPPRPLIEFVAFEGDNETGGQPDSLGSKDRIEKRLYWDSSCERVENLFKTSADFCLELRSLVSQVTNGSMFEQAPSVGASETQDSNMSVPSGDEVVVEQVTIDAKRKRGRRQIISDEKKAAAANLKASGGTNSQVAAMIYGTKYPSVQQTKNVPAILRHYKRKSDGAPPADSPPASD